MENNIRLLFFILDSPYLFRNIATFLITHTSNCTSHTDKTKHSPATAVVVVLLFLALWWFWKKFIFLIKINAKKPNCSLKIVYYLRPNTGRTQKIEHSQIIVHRISF